MSLLVHKMRRGIPMKKPVSVYMVLIFYCWTFRTRASADQRHCAGLLI